MSSKAEAAQVCQSRQTCQIWDNCGLWGQQCHWAYTYELTCGTGDNDNATQVPCGWLGVGVLYEACIWPSGGCGGPRATDNVYCP